MYSTCIFDFIFLTPCPGIGPHGASIISSVSFLLHLAASPRRTNVLTFITPSSVPINASPDSSLIPSHTPQPHLVFNLSFPALFAMIHSNVSPVLCSASRTSNGIPILLQVVVVNPYPPWYGSPCLRFVNDVLSCSYS